MPRNNENGQYNLPAGTEAVTGTTISSTKFNQMARDIEADLNTPRPVSAGGTGVATKSALLTMIDKRDFSSLAALLEDSSAYDVGTTFYTRAEGYAYVAIASGGDQVTSGGVHLKALPNEAGQAPAMAYAQPSSKSLDNTASIQQALNSQHETVIPVAPEGGPAIGWRVDGTLVVPEGKILTLQDNAILSRAAQFTNNTAELVRIGGSYVILRGGYLHHQASAGSAASCPDGIVKVGPAAPGQGGQYNWWKIQNVRMAGHDKVGDIGINVYSDEPVTGTSSSTYFGTIENPIPQYVDRGIRFMDVANAHTVINPQFYRIRGAALEFRGAYGNSVFGGFLHNSHDGVIGVSLRDRTTTANPHHSEANMVRGFGIEPGGATSKGVVIEANCAKNNIDVMGNVAGGNIINNVNNNVDTAFAQAIVSRSTRWAIDAHSHGREQVVAREGSSGHVENVAVPLFNVAVPSSGGLVIKVDGDSYNATLGRSSQFDMTFGVHRIGSGGVQISAGTGLSAGTNGTLSVVAVTPNAVVQFTPFNNGTSTTSTIRARCRVILNSDDARGGGGVITVR